MSSNHFTPTQRAIMQVLSDGRPHHKSELMQCLNDELSSPSAIFPHISLIRTKLRRRGEKIILIKDGKECFYQLRRVLASPYRE